MPQDNLENNVSGDNEAPELRQSPPITELFEHKDLWTLLSNAVTAPKGNDSKSFFLQIKNYKEGLRPDKIAGYQYEISQNFPGIKSQDIYKKILDD